MSHRSRPMVEVNLKSDSGRAVMQELAGKADAIIEGYHPGARMRVMIDHYGLRLWVPAMFVAADYQICPLSNLPLPRFRTEIGVSSMCTT